jgi:hypothetical protein
LISGSVSLRREEMERERTRRTNSMLISMVVIFVISWLPLNIYNLIHDFYAAAASWRFTRAFFVLTHAVAMSSCCYNPFLYAWLNDNFRNEFKRMFSMLPCLASPCLSTQSAASSSAPACRTRNDLANNAVVMEMKAKEKEKGKKGDNLVRSDDNDDDNALEQKRKLIADNGMVKNSINSNNNKQQSKKPDHHIAIDVATNSTTISSDCATTSTSMSANVNYNNVDQLVDLEEEGRIEEKVTTKCDLEGLRGECSEFEKQQALLLFNTSIVSTTTSLDEKVSGKSQIDYL